MTLFLVVTNNLNFRSRLQPRGMHLNYFLNEVPRGVVWMWLCSCAMYLSCCRLFPHNPMPSQSVKPLRIPIRLALPDGNELISLIYPVTNRIQCSVIYVVNLTSSGLGELVILYINIETVWDVKPESPAISKRWSLWVLWTGWLFNSTTGEKRWWH